MMTVPQAKQVLLAYRPWAPADPDPEMAEALALCRTDAELSQWFARHCEAQTALRAKWQGIKAPEGLQEQIVSEYRARRNSRKAARSRMVMVLACVAMVVSGWFIWKFTLSSPREDLSFDGYRNRMARTAARSYGMDLETNDVAVIRAHLAAGQAPTSEALPEALGQTPLVGCGVLRWQDRPVAMVCYRTTDQLPPGTKSDLILFVANQADVAGAADLAGTQFRKVSGWFTASWRTGDKIYLLAGLDETELRKRL